MIPLIVDMILKIYIIYLTRINSLIVFDYSPKSNLN